MQCKVEGLRIQELSRTQFENPPQLIQEKLNISAQSLLLLPLKLEVARYVLPSLHVKLNLFKLHPLLFLANYPNHLLYQLVAAVMTLTGTHLGVVRAIYHGHDEAIAGTMVILNAFIRSGNNVK